MHRQLPLLQLVNTLLPSPMITLQPLQPDRPASSYQQSYTKFHEQKLSSKLSQTQISQLMQQIEDLKEQLARNKTLSKTKESDYHEKLLLMSIQVQRVRTIMRQQGQTIQKAKHEWSQLQSIYMLKLQQTKIHMSRQFEEQLKAKSEQSANIIEQVRQLYIEKIASITQEYEKQLKLKDYESTHQQEHKVKLQISEMKEQELDNRVVLLTGENQRMEQQLFVLKRQLQEQRAHNIANIPSGTVSINFNPSSHNRPSLRLQQDYEQAIKLNHLLNTQIEYLRTNIKETSNKLSNQLSQLQHESKTKEQELEMMKWKYHKLQQELNEFKNRKTATNIPQTNNQNKKTLFINNLRTQKEQVPRRQTQQRISYQQSLKKIYQLQVKVDQLNNQINKKDELIEQQADQLDEKTIQANSFKKSLLEKDNNIKQLMHQLAQNSKKDSSIDTVKKDTLALIQKDQLIFSLKEQIDKKQSILNKFQNDIKKLQKDIEKLVKRQKDLQNQLNENDQNYNTRLKAKDNQIKAKQSEIKVKQSQIKVKENQLKSKQSLIKALQAEIREIKSNQPQTYLKQIQTRQIRAKQTQLKFTNQQLKHLNDQNNFLKEQIRKKNLQLHQSKQQTQKFYQQIINKNQELQWKQEEIMKLNEKTKQHISFYDQPHTQRKASQHKNKRHEQIQDPFADPFINNQDKETINNFDEYASLPTDKSRDIQAKLNQYEQKIIQLQNLVQSLQFQWGQTEQNQNAIFTYTKSAYCDQVKALKDKLKEKDRIVKDMQEMLDVMAKKGQNQYHERKASKSKGKNKK